MQRQSGRPDVVCEPDAAHEGTLPAIVCEAKFERNASLSASLAELQSLANAALDAQALPKCHAYGLAGAGALLWGAAFDATKHVAVAAARL